MIIREQLKNIGIEVQDPVALEKAKKVEEMTLAGLPLKCALDKIQICIGILDKIKDSSPKIFNRKCMDHIRKLQERGWKFKKVLQVSKLEGEVNG